MEYLETDIFLSRADLIPIIDVRSPGEYEKAHIPKAYNIALFSNNERSMVGTIYANEGQPAAITEGVKYVGPKLDNFKRRAEKFTAGGQLLIHCWRGGMRSEKMAAFFEENGFQCYVLKGGYKAYRKQLREDFSKINKLFVLEGPTGSGKTEILQAMSDQGAQVIDLEDFANHRGSTFGWIGKEEQPSTAQFQNDIDHRLRELNTEKPIWVEGESLKIGKVTLPESLWNKMNSAEIFNINLDKHVRTERIVAEYGRFTKKELLLSLAKIKTRLGNLNYDKTKEFINNRNLGPAVSILLEYYDKTYFHSLKTNRKNKPHNIELTVNDPVTIAKVILKNSEPLLYNHERNE